MSDNSFKGREMRSNCYRVHLPTTNTSHNTANTEGFGYVTVLAGDLCVVGPTIRSVALLFPEATEVSLIGPALAIECLALSVKDGRTVDDRDDDLPEEAIEEQLVGPE